MKKPVFFDYNLIKYWQTQLKEQSDESRKTRTASETPQALDGIGETGRTTHVQQVVPARQMGRWWPNPR
jgi:hypothetical protein